LRHFVVCAGGRRAGQRFTQCRRHRLESWHKSRTRDAPKLASNGGSSGSSTDSDSDSDSETADDNEMALHGNSSSASAVAAVAAVAAAATVPNLLRCPLASDCVDGTCMRLHPCGAKGDKRWLPPDQFGIRTSGFRHRACLTCRQKKHSKDVLRKGQSSAGEDRDGEEDEAAPSSTNSNGSGKAPPSADAKSASHSQPAAASADPSKVGVLRRAVIKWLLVLSSALLATRAATAAA